MKLQWNESFDEYDNSVWEANSNKAPGKDIIPYKWRIKQRLVDNVRRYYDASDARIRTESWWTELDDAKAYFENINDGCGD